MREPRRSHRTHDPADARADMKAGPERKLGLVGQIAKKHARAAGLRAPPGAKRELSLYGGSLVGVVIVWSCVSRRRS